MKTICIICSFIILNVVPNFYSFSQSEITDSNSRAFLDQNIKKIKYANPNKTLDTNTVSNLIAISKRIKYPEAETQLSFFKGTKLIQVGQFNEAVALLQPLVEQSGSKRLDSLKVLSCIKISEAGIGLGNYFISLQYLEKAAELNAASETGLLAIALHNAHIWTILPEKPQFQNFRKALDYCLVAEKIAKKLDNMHNLGMSLSNSGMLYSKLQMWDSAIVKFKNAAQIGAQHQLPYITQLSLFGTAIMLFAREEYDKALNTLQESHAIQQDKDPNKYSEIKIFQIATLIKLKRFHEAQKIINEIHINSADADRRLHQYKSELYESLGQYKNSLENYKKYILIRDSIAGESMLQELNYLDYKYKTIEKNKKILESELLLNQKNNLLKRQYFIIIGSVFIAIIAFLSTLTIYIYNRNKRRLKNKEDEINKMQYLLEGELKERERIAMDLHDSLGGLISSIRLKFEMAVLEKFKNENEIDKMQTLIANAATSVREIAHNLTPPEFAYCDFGIALRDYCSNINSNPNLTIVVKIQENISISKSVNLELLAAVKELVHNIIKHADASQASISITQEKTKLIIVVRDNGKGYTTQASQTFGTGIMNVKNRIKKLKGTIRTFSKPDSGTEVKIVVNLRAV